MPPPTSQASMDFSSVWGEGVSVLPAELCLEDGAMKLRGEMLWSTFGESRPTNEGRMRGKPAEWQEQRSRSNWGLLGDIWRASLPLFVLLFLFSLLAVTKASLSASHLCRSAQHKHTIMLQCTPSCINFISGLSLLFSFCGRRLVAGKVATRQPWRMHKSREGNSNT